MVFDNVNVNVSGPVQPTSTYKTKVLKGNHSFASQVTEPNRKYVIKYDFDLGGETVVIPEGSILEFDGGRVGNGAIDFTNALNDEVYWSWFKDQSSAIKTINYLSYKTFVIDRDVELEQPISNNINLVPNLYHLTIRGDILQSNSETKHITARGFSAFDLKAREVTIAYLTINNWNSYRVPSIKLTTWNDVSADLDSRIIGCRIVNTLGPCIQATGRGLLVDTNQLSVAVGSDNYNKFGAIELMLNASNESGVWQTREYSGRAFVIQNNRLHGTGAHLVYLKNNPDHPYELFRGVHITDNHADLSQGLLKVENKNINTLVVGNIIGARCGVDTIIIKADTQDMTVSSNSFQLMNIDNDYVVNKNVRDIAIYNNANVNGLIVTNNVLGCYNTSINVDNGSSLKNCIVKNNIYGKYSYTGNNKSKNILNIDYCNTDGIVIRDNIHYGVNTPDVIRFVNYKAGEENIIFKNIFIENNIGTTNNILLTANNITQLEYENIKNMSTAHNVISGENVTKRMVYGQGVIRISNSGRICFIDEGGQARNSLGYSDASLYGTSTPNMKESDVGFMYYFNSSSSKKRPLYWDGESWLDATGFSFALNRGETTGRPTGIAAGGKLDVIRDIGFEYFDTTLGKPIYVKEIDAATGVVTWVDATGTTV